MKPQAADARSVDELLAFLKRGARPKYVFFWSHRPKVRGCIDQSCLCNWYSAPFEINGAQYPTTEHFMMAAKAMLFSDADVFAEIVKSSSPERAKSLGRQVRGFREDVWAEHRFAIVVTGNQAKFEQNFELCQFLLGTGNRVLVEASPHDRIWGIGLAEDDPRASEPARWRGLNLLGFALMAVRSSLAESKGRAGPSR